MASCVIPLSVPFGDTLCHSAVCNIWRHPVSFRCLYHLVSSCVIPLSVPFGDTLCHSVFCTIWRHPVPFRCLYHLVTPCVIPLSVPFGDTLCHFAVCTIWRHPVSFVWLPGLLQRLNFQVSLSSSNFTCQRVEPVFKRFVYDLFGYLMHLFVFQQSVHASYILLYLVIRLLISSSTIPAR